MKKVPAWFNGVLFLLIAGIVIGLPFALWKPYKKLSGKGLNSRAWRSSYKERHIPVPPADHPRENWWGIQLAPVPHPLLSFILPERHVPGMFDIDAKGIQVASSHLKPRLRLMIFGGSVAAGAYASNLNRTYFKQLAWQLEDKGYPVQIQVSAAGAWTSRNELAALKLYGPSERPDAVIFLDGLNDVTLFPEKKGRAELYLKRMREARDFALAHHIHVIYAPQPFLPQKLQKTTLEMLIQVESVRPLERLLRDYETVRRGLQELIVPHQVYYMDCSGAFDKSNQTTFADIWHFSDVGHALLGEYMALKLVPLLSDVQHQKGI
jgi:hypothetical protein